MFESESIYTNVGVQHYHIKIGFLRPDMIISNVLFEHIEDAITSFFNLIPSLNDTELSDEELDMAEDAFYDLVEYSEDTHENAHIGLTTENLSLVLSDCFGCIPSGQN